MADVLNIQQFQLGGKAPKVGRVPRNPEHTFQLRNKPYQVQPFLIAPVLPAETLKNALLQARVVTDPIKNPLIGWWQEYYFFYVKLRDLDGRDDFSAMMLEYGKDLSAYNSAANAQTYHYASSIDWASLCLKRVTEEYFREEDETWNANLIDGLPAATIPNLRWMDSLVDETLIPEGDNPQTTPDNMESLTLYQQQYDYMRQLKMTEMTFEDWLATFGIKSAAKEEPNRPELLRYVKEWQYPSNTVDPTNGAPSSAVSWGIQERVDKDRFFKEPGFIFGVTVTRPKIYMSNQRGAAVHALDNAFGWMPAIMKHDPTTSLRQFAAGAGPIGNSTNGYWLDLRDLYVYGDQFVNFALTDTAAGMMALPTNGLQKRYPSQAMVEAMFSSTLEGGGQDLTKTFVRQDGVCRLSILGTQLDHT